jgi:hypothetical protein
MTEQEAVGKSMMPVEFVRNCAAEREPSK